MKWISPDVVACIHEEVIAATGRSPGIRDRGLLCSAVFNPLATFGGEDLYPDLLAKVAALLYGLARGHPFVDGNKRTAFVVTVVVLRKNGLDFVASNDAVVTFNPP
ncbi:MAG: type II toxin-antitoxin system death-on-curing family toxin [Firmicutes bacterium]|nr:type II toxin-antitoxin system death-on-curing family toxin [Bacillota bacterium]